MKLIKNQHGHDVFWWDFENSSLGSLPKENWVCLIVANTRPDINKFCAFVKFTIDNGIVSFISCGKFGEFLQGLFDEIIDELEVLENKTQINVMTTWHNDESLSKVLWQAIEVGYLPESSDRDSYKLVCANINERNLSSEILSYLDKFDEGWIPDD